MSQGVPTPEDVEMEFRKHYLVTGSVSGSARAVGIPVSTGFELRNRAWDDPSFVKAREAIRARLLPDAEQMATAVMQICLERLNKEPPDIEKLASLGAQRVSFQDPAPQYAASFAKTYQAIVGAHRFEAERSGDIPTAKDLSGAIQVNLTVVKSEEPAPPPNETTPPAS